MTIEEASKLSKYTCTKCGRNHEPIFFGDYANPIDPDTYTECEERDIMIAEKVCFNCAFWINKTRLELPPECKRLIFNNSHYISHGWQENSHDYFRGFGGATFYLKMDDGTYYRTNNLWFQGNIPEIFREELPDNCVQITKEEYEKAMAVREFEKTINSRT